MIECSLFSVKKDIRKLRSYLESRNWRMKPIKENLLVYIGKKSKMYYFKSSHRLTQRSMYDYNKERCCMCSVTTESALLKVENVEQFLEDLGFVKEKELDIRGFCYKHGGVRVDITHTGVTEKSDFDAPEKKHDTVGLGNEGLDDSKEMWLLKLCTQTESISEGEGLLMEIREALKEYVKFIKPPVDWFNRNFVGKPI